MCQWWKALVLWMEHCKGGSGKGSESSLLPSSSRRRGRKHQFEFNTLPVELRHLVLKKLKTKFLDEVCAQVCTEWQGMVYDILEQRRANVGQIIPDFFRKEIQLRIKLELSGDPLELLKYYENALTSDTVTATMIEVNRDVAGTRTGLLYKLMVLRGECDCVENAECLLRRLHILPAHNLFAVDCDSHHGGLEFYNIRELERVDKHRDYRNIVPYRCDKTVRWLGSNHKTNTGISVFRDHIVVETAAKTLLLLKIINVDHTLREVDLDRLRIVHLPLWVSGVCLFESKLVVLYTTGHVGMWDMEADELYISAGKCELGEIKPGFIHRTKVYRVGTLVFIKTNATGTGPQRWYMVDSEDSSVRIHGVDMLKIMEAGLIRETDHVQILDVFHIDIWCNSLIVHFKGLKESNSQNHTATDSRLAFKRIHRYPTVADFLDEEKFQNDFLSLNAGKNLVSVPAEYRIAFTSPFIPLSLKAWQLEPKVGDPVPIADMICAQLTPTDRRLDTPRKYIRGFRIRISNLPPK